MNINWKLLRSKRKTNWQSFYDRHMCSPWCKGTCPCPEPYWRMNCNQKIPKKNPQTVFLFDSGSNLIDLIHRFD